MKERIQEEINLLAKAREIKVILACETGSRVWGFASPDSDYDVRMIYVKPLDWYLKLNEGKDTLEVMLDDGELDITGWELRKTLRLLKKSNAALL
ncbi:MAG: nucleotidyltransferase domain-containing protein, partial [Flavobacteriales bacterium]|nr:nucleotidyltransferase domain-containing protein [Flavobacteriales bacterium]